MIWIILDYQDPDYARFGYSEVIYNLLIQRGSLNRKEVGLET